MDCQVSVTEDYDAYRTMLEGRDNVTFLPLGDLIESESYGHIAEAELPLDEFNHNETVYLRVSATDAVGNVSDYAYSSYIVDKLGPAITPVIPAAKAR